MNRTPNTPTRQPSNCTNSNIPLRRSLIRTNSNSSGGGCSTSPTSKIPINNGSSGTNGNNEALRWRQKYDESEARRKSLLTEKEKTVRQYNDLHLKHLHLQDKNEQLDTELFERNEQLEKLRTVSESLYKEYQTLRNQYETESGAMSRALKDASGWYKENRELKRRTLFLAPADGGDTVDEGVDAGEAASDSDIDNLNRTIKQLSADVAELQTEVDSLRHVEFQTTEQNIKLAEELEAEKGDNERLKRELSHLRQEHDQLVRVAELMKKEMQELQRSEEQQRAAAQTLRKEADAYKRERNVLAHQSTLLCQNLQTDDFALLHDIEELKRTLEEERNRHEEEVRTLNDKIEELESNAQIELLEERLRIVESELSEARRRTNSPEHGSVPPPPPLPPPPPSLPPPPPPPPEPPLRVKRRSRANLTEIAEAIGVQRPETAEATTPARPKAGVNDDIINAIKEGKFTLKKAKSEKRESGNKTVSELLNALGALRRTPRSRQKNVDGVS